MSEDNKRANFLTPAKSRLLGITIMLGCVFALFALTALTIQVLAEFLILFSSVLWPLAIASILAILLKPLVKSIETKFNLGPNLSILLLYLLVLVVVGVLFWGVGGEVIRQYRELASSSVNWPNESRTKSKD